MHKTLILLVAGLPLAACERAAVPQATEETVASAAAETTSGRGAASSSSAHHVVAPKIALDGGGLRLVGTTGSTRLIPFGSPREPIESAVAASLGGDGKRSELGECGAGPMEFTTFGGLKLNFQDGRFLGWTASDDSALATMDGIGPGTKRSEVQTARKLTMIPNSTLGAEFSLGEAEQNAIGGFFEGSGTTTKVASLYAGLTCFFR